MTSVELNNERYTMLDIFNELIESKPTKCIYYYNGIYDGCEPTIIIGDDQTIFNYVLMNAK